VFQASLEGSDHGLSPIRYLHAGKDQIDVRLNARLFDMQRFTDFAIALAGDLTFYGRRDNVLVIRENNNKREFARLDLTKPEIMKSVREGAAKPKDPKETPGTYSAEDIKVSQYGDVAVLTFRLVSHQGEKVNYYRNTGVLENRNGKWQVVAWQATKAPEYKPEGDKKPTGKE